LKELNLANTSVGEEDCAQLALLVESTNLEELMIGENGLSSNSVATIMEGLLKNSTIKHLNVWDSYFSEENCMSLALLLQQAECQLRTLDIEECSISGEEAAHLAAALTNNHSLTELNISFNPIGDIGAAAFGDLVSINTALTTLDMVKCGITSEGCVQLEAGLTGNNTLQSLLMAGNH
jgi:Ran GTPase-activating protein (RanGAP) involved in mRNA processing and transport